jgi:hypothetical protein
MAYPPDPLKIVKREQEEFAKMQDGIKDIDWYKAETETARNGQKAAEKFAAAKSAEANAWRDKFYSVDDDVEKLLSWFSKAVCFVVIGFLLGMLIGAWIW